MLPLTTVLAQGIALDPKLAVFEDNPEPGNTGGPGPGATQPNSGDHGSSSCFYPGDTDGASVTLYEQPFTSATDIAQEIETDQFGGTPSTVAGFTVYTDRPHANQWDIAITNNQVLAELDLTLSKADYRGHTPSTVVADLTTAVVTGLRQPPGPASRLRYDPPYRDINPCAIFTANDFLTYLHVPDDQHPHVELQMGERELDPTPGGTPRSDLALRQHRMPTILGRTRPRPIHRTGHRGQLRNLPDSHAGTVRAPLDLRARPW